MNKFSAISLFCEHIRREEGGIETLIGLLPDNIKVSSAPGVLPTLAVYTRINFSPDYDPEHILITLFSPGGEELSKVDVKRETIERAMKPKEGQQKEIAGIKSQVSSINAPVDTAGAFRVMVRTKDEEFLSGIMNVEVDMQAPASETAASKSLSQ